LAARADEARAKSESMQDAYARATFGKLAEIYDKLADDTAKSTKSH
jgi:hypothetical protein